MSALTELLSRFLNWWTAELKAALPGRLRALTERSRPEVAISIDGANATVIEAIPGATIRESETLPIEEAAAAAVRRAQERNQAIELRFAHRGVYVRRTELPDVSPAEISRMLMLDLERSTPFVPQQIYSAHTARPRSGEPGRLDVDQLVIKKSLVDEALLRVTEAGGRVDWVGCWNKDRSAPMPVDFLVRDQSRSPARWLVPALAVVMLVSAGVVSTQRYENAVQQVASQVAAERETAGAVQRSLEKSRKQLDQEGSLKRLAQTRVPPLAIIEQLSRALPDNTYLSEIRIDGDTVEMSGIGKMAAGLPQLLEKTGYFTDANLTSPLTIDSRDDRERFSLKARYREP